MADVKQVESNKDIDTSAEDTKTTEAEQKLNNAINAAVKNHLKRSFSKDLPDMFAKLLDERGIGKAKELKIDETDESDEEEVKVSKPAKQIGKIKDVEDLKTRRELDALKAELKTERELSKQKEAMTEVKGFLAGKVRPELMDMAMKLISHDKMVQIAKDGTISFKYDDEDYDLEEGVTAWMKSKDAAHLLSAPSNGPKKDAKKAGFKPLLRNDKSKDSEKDPKQKTIEAFQRLGLRL